jgi:YidC/Oxa1 family membrane protein insertase
MNKDTATGLLLMGVILFGFMLCNRPKPNPEQTAQATEQVADSATNVQALPGDADRAELIQSVKAYGTVSDQASKTISLTNANINLSVDSANVLSGTVKVNGADVAVEDIFDNASGALTPEQRAGAAQIMRQSVENLSKYKSFSHFLEGPNDTIYLENQVMKVAIESRGGRICQVTLKDYDTEYGGTHKQVEMFSGENSGYDFEFETADQRISTRDLIFTPINADSNSVVMALEMENGAKFGFKYTINPTDQYLVKMDIVQDKMNTIIPDNRRTMKFNWHLDMPRTQEGRTFEERNSAIYYKLSDETPDDLSANADDKADVNGNLKWVAFKNQYFSSVIVARTHFQGAELNSQVLKDSDCV